VKRGRHGVPIASSVPPTLHCCRSECGLGHAEANHHSRTVTQGYRWSPGINLTSPWSDLRRPAAARPSWMSLQHCPASTSLFYSVSPAKANCWGSGPHADSSISMIVGLAYVTWSLFVELQVRNPDPYLHKQRSWWRAGEGTSPDRN